MASKDGPTRKVRMACLRCRTRRVRCDGQVPACGNCSKAGAACIDVDGRNAEQLIPRNFAVNARARIDWLEDIIRTRLPDVDLHEGPQLDPSTIDDVTTTTSHAPQSIHIEPSDDMTESRLGVRSMASVSNLSSSNAPGASKRPHSSVATSDGESPLSNDARTVAVDLGMLALNADSRQKHFIGSSSGLLFTHLIGATSGTHSTLPDLSRYSYNPRTPIPKRLRGKSLAPTQQAKTYYRAIYTLLKENLPPKEECDYLVGLYLSRIHSDYPFLHPISLLKTISILYRCTDVDTDTDVAYNGWPSFVQPFEFNGEIDYIGGQAGTPVSITTIVFHAFMVFNIASLMRPNMDYSEFTPTQFYRAAMSVGSDCLSGTSLVSLQAVLLLCVRSLMAPAELNMWTLIHVAMAHCIDLGIHRETDHHSEVVRDIRRSVFYSTYSLDRGISTIQGRPLGLREEAFDVNMPSINVMALQESDDTSGTEIAPTGTMPYSIHRFKLDKIVSEIKMLMHHLPIKRDYFVWPTDLEQCQQKIRSNLDNWSSEIATVIETLVLDNDLERHRLSTKLRLKYYTVAMLLYQPSHAFRRPTNSALSFCFQFASQRIRCYNALHEQDCLHPGWRSVHGVFASGVTMIYCFWVSESLQQDRSVRLTLSKDLRSCSNLLSVGGESWPSVKRGKKNFEKLVDQTMQRLGDLHGNQGTSENVDNNINHPELDVAVPVSNLCLVEGAQHFERSNDFFPNLSTPINPLSSDPMISGEDLDYTDNNIFGMDLNFDDAYPINHTAEIEGFLTQFFTGDHSWDLI